MNNSIIKVMIDNVKFDRKPTPEEVRGEKYPKNEFEKGITYRLGKDDKIVSIAPKDLAKKLTEGYTFRPSICGRKEETWKCQEVFVVDVDETMTIQDGIDKCKELGIKPNFIYTTFSHTETDHRYRIVFTADRIMTDYDIAKKVQLILINIFKSDKSCKNLNRLYYGGRNIVYENYSSILNIDELIKEYGEGIEIEPTKSKGSKSSRGNNGVQDKNNINNFNYILNPKNPKNSKAENNEINYNIQALKDKNIEYLKTVIARPTETKVFETKQEFFDYILKIDLAELLGIEYFKSFNCIFHDDKSPSASIFQDRETGNYIYKCNSSKCDVAYNIIGVIEVLGKFKSRPDTYEFIKELFNLEIMETEWQKKQKEILLENLDNITFNELRNSCGQAHKNTKNIMRYLEQLHYIALRNIYDEKFSDEEGNVLFFASIGYIAELLGISQNSLNKVSQKIAVLTYHKLINKIPSDKINPELLKKSQHLNMKNNNDNYKHINYFSIPSYTYNLYKEIEEQAKKWKQNGYTMKGVSREMFYRCEGLEVANWLYPQFDKVTEKVNGVPTIVDRTTTKQSDERTDDIVKAIFYLIDVKGYALEKEIVYLLQGEHGKENIQLQIKKSLQEILDSYDLKRIRANKQLKELYSMDIKGYPFLLLRK